MIYRKSKDDIAHMRRAGRILAKTLLLVERAVAPGVRTRELDEIAETSIRGAGGVPTFKGIYGDPSRGIPPFPGTLCISVNEQVVHGMPSNRRLREGDIVAVDCGVTLTEGGRAFVADSALTMPVGEVTAEVAKLLEVTEAALYNGIEQATAEGASLRWAGKVPEGLGPGFVAPHVFVDVARDSALWQEEVFGPVLAVTPFDSEAEARISGSLSIWTVAIRPARRSGSSMALSKPLADSRASALP